MTSESSIALAERHRDTFITIQDNAVDLSLMAWDSLDDYTSPEAPGTWADLWLPITDGAVDAAMVATDTYFATATNLSHVGAVGVSAAALRNVATEVYARRPLATIYTELSKGIPWDAALKAARDQVAAIAASDASLGQRHVADEWVKTKRIVGYRRTLSGASCALCAIASTQRYHSSNLMPIHPHCDCGVAEIHGDDDPGQVINKGLLDELKAQGPAYWKRPYGVGEDGKLYRRKTETVRDNDGKPVVNEKTGKPRTRMALGDPVLPKVRNHGELGPVLWAPGDHFLGPNDLN